MLTDFLLHFYFSGMQESKREAIDISKLDSTDRDHLRQTLVRSGFALQGSGEYNLLPCPLGSFVESSFTDPKCKNCSAGKL